MSSHYFTNRIFFNVKSVIFHCKFTIFVYFKLRFHFTDAKKICYFIHFLLPFLATGFFVFFDFFVFFLVDSLESLLSLSELLDSFDSLLSLYSLSLLDSSDFSDFSSFFAGFFVCLLFFFGYLTLYSLFSLSSDFSDSSLFSYFSLHFLIASFKSALLFGMFPWYNPSFFIYFNRSFNSLTFILSILSLSSLSSSSFFNDFFVCFLLSFFIDLSDLVNSSFSIF